MRLPAEKIDFQIAVDAYLPPGARRGIARDGTAHLIPVQEIECDDGGEQRKAATAMPVQPEEAAPGKTKIAEIRYYPFPLSPGQVTVSIC